MEICVPCLLRIGDMVARPWMFGELERQMFIEGHSDAVELVHQNTGDHWVPKPGGPLD